MFMFLETFLHLYVDQDSCTSMTTGADIKTVLLICILNAL